MTTPLGRSLMVLALCVLPAVLAAQAGDTTRVSAPADSAQPEIKPPLSARRAFFSSLVFPGYGQSVLGRKRSGAMMLAMEALSIVMVRETALGLREARRNALDSVIVSYVDANGAPSIKYRRTGFPTSLIRTRKEQHEDWVAALVANHLFSATDALVSALLWDLPAEIGLNGNRKAFNLGLTVRIR